MLLVMGCVGSLCFSWRGVCDQGRIPRLVVCCVQRRDSSCVCGEEFCYNRAANEG